MSSFPTPNAPPPMVPLAEPQGQRTGLAVAGFVTALIGLCTPGIGVIGLVMSIVATTRAARQPQTYGGKGLAIGGIVCGSLSILTNCLVIGTVAPAILMARDAARRTVSATHLREIGQALNTYAIDNKDKYPEVGANLRDRLGSAVLPKSWESAMLPEGSLEPSFLYVGGQTLTFSGAEVLMFENPAFAGRGVNVLYQDGQVHMERFPEAWTLLSKLKNVTTPEGTGWSVPARR